MAITEQERTNLIVSHEKAQGIEMKYLARINGELFARGLVLTHAMDKYNAFLNLPATDQSTSAIWDFAYSILSTAVPLLRLTDFVKKLETNASVAYAIAKATGDKGRAAAAAKTAAKVARKAGETAEKINDAKEKVEKIKEGYDKVTQEQESNPLGNLDAARKPILDLIKAGQEAEAAWGKAIDAELLEFENRLNGFQASKQGTLEDYVKSLLPPVPTFNKDELLEIENLYLWQLIGAYVKDNVQIVKTTVVTQIMRATSQEFSRGTPTYSVQGLNNTQQQTILGLFGPQAKRGKIFFMPALLPTGDSIWFFLGYHNAKTVEKTEHRAVVTPSGKM